MAAAVAPAVANAPAASAAATAATAPAMEIATLELTLADPLTQELIHHHGGALPVLDLASLNPVLQEQVDRYGADLTARLMQLAQANAAVRDMATNPVVFIGVMTLATAGAFGVAWGAGVTAGTGIGIGAGAGVVGAMTAGAAFGAIGGFYGGLINEGRIDLGGMFRGSLTGAVTAGVVRASGLDRMGITTGTNAQEHQTITSIDYFQRALAVTGQATLQGALQQISGGDFVDGFTSGLAQGLGAEVVRGPQLQIDTLSANRSIETTQAGTLRQFARAAQSAVSLLGNPVDPGHEFAMTFVNGLVGDWQQRLDA